uniref:EF-hand domain-containing protein D2-like n=1 Tax=Saccoglossus kowalevskii TaxID=10224 RepID=A0ABM0GKD6_SACKO|nr:PREDICTED: EF-hand domain-containing protein D2-like [Saccoglossus kowalevskii]
MAVEDELSKKLARRQALNEGEEVEELPVSHSMAVFNPYTEFKEFSRKQIKEYEKMFAKYDVGGDKFIDLMELKLMMEKLGAPQTHVGLKEMIQTVDEDHDGKISFREFLLIFRKAAEGDLIADSGLSQLATLSEIDVDKEGVKGAADFFSAKWTSQLPMEYATLPVTFHTRVSFIPGWIEALGVKYPSPRILQHQGLARTPGQPCDSQSSPVITIVPWHSQDSNSQPCSSRAFMQKPGCKTGPLCKSQVARLGLYVSAMSQDITFMQKPGRKTGPG